MTKKKRGKKSSKKQGIVQKYKESWEFLKDSKNFVFFILGLFIVCSLLGFFIMPSQAIIDVILELLQELIEITENMDGLELILFIFWNNLKVSFIGMISGILFGVLPLIETIANGYLLGFVADQAVKLDGWKSLWMIFPHGIFELPAVFIALGLGLRMGVYFFQKEQKEKMTYKDTIFQCIQLFFLVVLPLLAIAAIIEGLLIFYLR